MNGTFCFNEWILLRQLCCLIWSFSFKHDFRKGASPKKWNFGSPISKKALYHLDSVWKQFKKFISQCTMENAFNWCATQAKKQRTSTRKRLSVLFFCFLKWRRIFDNFNISTALVFTSFFLGVIFTINQHDYWTEILDCKC